MDQAEFNRMLKEAMKDKLSVKLRIKKDYSRGKNVIDSIHVEVKFDDEVILSDYDYA